MSVGILALQGGVAEHRAALADVGLASRPVRRPEDLRPVHGLVIPGGESTTLMLLLGSSGLREPVSRLIAEGMPVLGTCAGLILLAGEVLDGRPDQWSFGALDVSVRRNGYGRQQQSFEVALDPTSLDAALGDPHGDPLPTVFIRAPRIERIGATVRRGPTEAVTPEVEVLAALPHAGGRRVGQDRQGTDPVLVRQGPILAAAFHPELTPDRRVHRLFAATVAGEASAMAVGRVARSGVGGAPGTIG